MKKRLMSMLLAMLCMLVAAMPVSASSWQGFDLYPGDSEKSSRWHYGEKVQISVFHNQGNLGDVYWELKDYYGNLLDSGTLAWNDTNGYTSIVYDIEPQPIPQLNMRAQLTLYCLYFYSCNTYGVIETW